MSEKILICDIDSTLNDHWVRIRRNTVPQWPGQQISSNAWNRDEVLKDSLLPNCREVLCSLQDMHFYIRYLSARGWADARRITIEQLQRWGVPNPQDVLLCNSIIDKVKVLSKDTCDFYVDDFMTGQEKSIGTFHKEVAQAIEAKGIRIIVFRNDWNDVLEQIKIWESKK